MSGLAKRGRCCTMGVAGCRSDESGENPIMSGVWYEGRSPGRLDVLGGVAEFSGSLVLQMPTRSETVVRVRELDAPEIRIRFAGRDDALLSLEAWIQILRTSHSGKEIGRALQLRGLPSWMQEPMACLWVLAVDKGWIPHTGLEFEITMEVPSNGGLGSRVSLEVATLRALEALSGIPLEGVERAVLVHKASAEFVGVPCCLADSLVCDHGQRGFLLPVLCRPGLMQRQVPIPQGLLVVGWPCGVKHAIAANPPVRVRTAAFMGRTLMERATGRAVACTSDFTPMEYREHQDHLPVAIKGEEYLDAWGGNDASAPRVDPETVYPVRAATQFAIEENDRAARAVASMQRYHLEKDESLLWETGGHLYASHAAYGAMGLGCAETDLMVDYLQQMPLSRGIYGARVSGTGLGGTVVVMLKESALRYLEELAHRLTPGQKLIF